MGAAYLYNSFFFFFLVKFIHEQSGVYSFILSTYGLPGSPGGSILKSEESFRFGVEWKLGAIHSLTRFVSFKFRWLSILHTYCFHLTIMLWTSRRTLDKGSTTLYNEYDVVIYHWRCKKLK